MNPIRKQSSYDYAVSLKENKKGYLSFSAHHVLKHDLPEVLKLGGLSEWVSIEV